MVYDEEWLIWYQCVLCVLTLPKEYTGTDPLLITGSGFIILRKLLIGIFD